MAWQNLQEDILDEFVSHASQLTFNEVRSGYHVSKAPLGFRLKRVLKPLGYSCTICQEPLEGKNKGKMYCSEFCKARKKRGYKGRLPCLVCGGGIPPQDSAGKKYCSPSCRRFSWNSTRTARRKQGLRND